MQASCLLSGWMDGNRREIRNRNYAWQLRAINVLWFSHSGCGISWIRSSPEKTGRELIPSKNHWIFPQWVKNAHPDTPWWKSCNREKMGKCTMSPRSSRGRSSGECDKSKREFRPSHTTTTPWRQWWPQADVPLNPLQTNTCHRSTCNVSTCHLPFRSSSSWVHLREMCHIGLQNTNKAETYMWNPRVGLYEDILHLPRWNDASPVVVAGLQVSQLKNRDILQKQKRWRLLN